MIKIAPSILSADFARMGEAAANLAQWGADYIHCDVMDGRFVPNITFGPPMIAALKKISAIPLDVHLMIEEPERYVQAFVQAGADILTVHAEASRHLDRTLHAIKDAGARPGVVINPATPVAVLENVLGIAELVLIMSVNPGFGGQSFIPYSLQKVAALRKMISQSGRAIELEIDGGVTPQNIQAVLAAGADVIVAGSAVFNAPDPAAVIRQLRG